MCGQSDQLAKGGAMVVIHPLKSLNDPQDKALSARLWFSNGDCNKGEQSFTSLTSETGNDRSRRLLFSCRLRIHKHGQLGISEEDHSEESFLWEADMNSHRMRPQELEKTMLRERLNLHAGPDGIIGRMVTLMYGTERIGEGVIGWI